MNELIKRFGSKLAIVGVPTNQFGHQENTNEDEILNSLKHVRPGNGFEPLFPLSAKVTVNGEGEDPLFAFLKEALPFPCDDPYTFLRNASPHLPIWSPIKRNDIRWNFEKFLVGKDGTPLKRFSPSFETINVADEIEAALSQ